MRKVVYMWVNKSVNKIDEVDMVKFIKDARPN